MIHHSKAYRHQHNGLVYPVEIVLAPAWWHKQYLGQSHGRAYVPAGLSAFDVFAYDDFGG